MSTHVVTIDAADAIEAAEMLCFVESWLAEAGSCVTSDFEAFAAPYPLVELRAELIALAASLGASTMGGQR
jgi:hypothetical protein